MNYYFCENIWLKKIPMSWASFWSTSDAEPRKDLCGYPSVSALTLGIFNFSLICSHKKSPKEPVPDS